MTEARKQLTFVDVAGAIKPSDFLDVRDFLRTLFNHAKDHLWKYSYKQFAEDLGFSPTNVVHHIIQGRRPLTAKAAATISSALGLTGVEGKYFAALVDYANARLPVERDAFFQVLYVLKDQTVTSALSRDAMEYFSKWYHPVIGELARLDSFESDPKWISSNLIADVRPAQVAKSLALLERLGLIAYDQAKGRHVRTGKDLSTGHEARGLVIAKYHYSMIQNGRDAIALVDQKSRDISGLTLCISEASAQRIKEMIHRFQAEILAEESRCDRREQVYQLNLQLFPFTKIKGSR